MADPDSSIKSIFSGTVSLNDTEDEYGSQITQNKQLFLTGSDGLLRIGDNDSVSSQNLRYMNQTHAGALKNDLFPTSTNESVASSCSDYQHPFAAEADSFSLGTNHGLVSESVSRPASRNSTTSCLSTTATKDGIEGKKIYRHGPLPYFTNVINNMVHLQLQQLQPVPQRAPGILSPPDIPRPLKSDIDALAQPPVTLKEKIVLMNSDIPK